MRNILEQARINKLNDDLEFAIKSVGGDTSDAKNIFDYPQIILQQLCKAFNIEAGQGITITQKDPESNQCCNCCDHCSCCPPCPPKKPILIINANSEATIVSDITFGDGEVEKFGTTIQEVLAKIVDKIKDYNIGGCDFQYGEVIQATEEDQKLQLGDYYLKLKFNSVDNPFLISLQSIINASVETAKKGSIHYLGRLSKLPDLDKPEINLEINLGDIVSVGEDEYIKITSPDETKVEWKKLAGSSGGGIIPGNDYYTKEQADNTFLKIDSALSTGEIDDALNNAK